VTAVTVAGRPGDQVPQRNPAPATPDRPTR